MVVDYSGDLTWEQETIELSTVGIDIGSATTHVTFARIYLQRVGQLMTDRYTVVKRDVLGQSPVRLTPYLDRADQDDIDAAAVRELVRRFYADAGIRPSDVDTGAVLLTGVALLRRNAESLTRELAAYAGDFVCAAASHHLEAVLAAHGSGAVRHSVTNPGSVLSLDVGGGTAKFTWLRGGRVEHTAALGVGGRLVAWDDTLTVRRVESYADRIASALGVSLRAGESLPPHARDELCDAMASILAQAVGGVLTPLGKEIAVTEWPEPGEPPDTVILSGGVAELLADGAAPVNDLGWELGRRLRRKLADRSVSWRLAPSAIRATVLGAAGFSVDVSGNTVYLSDPALLPVRDVPVVTATIDVADAGQVIEDMLTAAIDRNHGLAGRPLCLYLDLTGRWAGYPEVRRLADAITAVRRRAAFGGPLAVVMKPDLARSLGRILDRECDLCMGLICLDGITLAAFDFIDIGAQRRAVHPVVIKSLVFGGG
ncbi:ethanolamine ammonia-lyase reactivating factor EutA [Actinophytocola sp.]|uniref:ethanolamine ammonia-lyase reactivating factor EutA n=1 Tax=Actinophytocola sp. TaxID=1872138 RepID=UPI003D6BC4DC